MKRARCIAREKQIGLCLELLKDLRKDQKKEVDSEMERDLTKARKEIRRLFVKKKGEFVVPQDAFISLMAESAIPSEDEKEDEPEEVFECVVCYEDFSRTECIFCQSNHVLCIACYNLWQQKNSPLEECPVCRGSF